jgi:hypothetical protein
MMCLQFLEELRRLCFDTPRMYDFFRKEKESVCLPFYVRIVFLTNYGKVFQYVQIPSL